MPLFRPISYVPYWRRTPLIPGVGTRLYLPSTGTAAVSPTFRTGWEDTSSASPARRAMATTKIASAMTTVAFTDLDATDIDILMYQGVSLPLSGDQTISAQNIRVVIRGIEDADTNNTFVGCIVYVVSNNGATTRGYLIGADATVVRDDVELDAVTLTTRTFSGTSGSVSALNGDRIVIELGVGGDPTLLTHDSRLRVGDAAASDLPYDDVTTDDLNPFIQFTQALVFGSEVSAFDGSLFPWPSHPLPVQHLGACVGF